MTHFNSFLCPKVSFRLELRYLGKITVYTSFADRFTFHFIPDQTCTEIDENMIHYVNLTSFWLTDVFSLGYARVRQKASRLLFQTQSGSLTHEKRHLGCLGPREAPVLRQSPGHADARSVAAARVPGEPAGRTSRRWDRTGLGQQRVEAASQLGASPVTIENKTLTLPWSDESLLRVVAPYKWDKLFFFRVVGINLSSVKMKA